MRLPVWPFTVMGEPPPPGWRRPPPPGPVAVARTVAAAAVAASSMVRMAARSGPAPATTSEAGLRELGAFCLRALAVLGVTLEVDGAERVPAEGGLVFMWNQASHLDHLVLPPAMPRTFHSLYNNELARTPIYGRYLRTSGHFWVDRNDEEQWRRSVAEAAERVRAGACVLVSPEGTRSWDGRLLPMKRGAFVLARQAERPIVCATVAGAHDRLPRGEAVVRPGPVRVSFSAPIPVRAGDPDLEAIVTETFARALL